MKALFVLLALALASQAQAKTTAEQRLALLITEQGRLGEVVLHVRKPRASGLIRVKRWCSAQTDNLAPYVLETNIWPHQYAQKPPC